MLVFFLDLDLALQPRNDHVKLHITLMNSGFYEYQCSVNGNSVNQSRLTFDARKIIEVRYANINIYVFMYIENPFNSLFN